MCSSDLSRHAGTFGDVGCFSFHPRKAITTGEGGMTTTADAAIDARIRRLRDHGASCSDFARHSASATMLAEYDVLGFNYRMTDIQGALGCAQMDRADDMLRLRRQHAARYDERLAAVDWLRRPRTPAEKIAKLLIFGLRWFPSGRRAPERTVPAPQMSRVVAEPHFLAGVAEWSRLERELLPRRSTDLFVKHPRLGDLTLEEWMQFHLIHARHHARQIRRRIL